MHPPWLDRGGEFPGDDDKLGYAIELARKNVEYETGGPFGAAVFLKDAAHPVGAGTNGVLRLQSSLLHAEIVALMEAHAVLRSHDLSGHELFASCEPCAMCLGAIFAAGIDRLVFAARREDAERVGFDEGPVFPESYAYVRDRGLEIVRSDRRADGAAVIELYAKRGGPIYG